jgi:Rrf2 family protein
MSGLLKISEAAVLALHALMYIAMKDGETVTNSEIAGFLHASENHLSKVLQRLAKAGLVKSLRGPKGGFVLGKDSGTIPLREIYELFEGALNTNTCLLETPVCGEECMFGGLLMNINALLTDFMTRTKLDDAVKKLGKGMTVNDQKYRQNQ